LLARYYIYVNVALTLLLGYLIVRAFADVIQEFLKLKYPIDVARAFRNVFLVIGVGALITTVAGEVGGGLAGVSVGGFLGIVIGFAMQQPLGQAISGLFILIARPFKINDYATILGDTGLVIEVGILFTELKKDDGSKVVIPSNLIIANKVYVLPKPTPASSPKQ
jgi:small-conductance mechanosensitive channel